MGHQSYFKLLSDPPSDNRIIVSDEQLDLLNNPKDPIWMEWPNFIEDMKMVSTVTSSKIVVERSDYNFDKDYVYIFYDGQYGRILSDMFYKHYCLKCFSGNTHLGKYSYLGKSKSGDVNFEFKYCKNCNTLEKV